MKKHLALMVILFLILSAFSPLVAQDTTDNAGESAEEEVSPILSSFIRNFARASLNTKIQILQDASQVDSTPMGPLYIKAVEFLLVNSDLIEADIAAQQLAVLAVRLIGKEEYKENVFRLWELFILTENTQIRVEILNTLGIVAGGDNEAVEKLNAWLDRQNTYYRAGQKADNQVIAEAVTTLGQLGDPSSFKVLFTTMMLKYSELISQKSRTALFAIQGDLKELFVQVIRKNRISDKREALEMAISTDRLTNEERGEIAEAALEVCLSTNPSTEEERENLRYTRFAAASALKELEWSKATDDLIENFNQAVVEYDRGLIRKTYFLESIAALGAMGTREAAERLNQYLMLLNSYIENGQAVDEQVTLAVIKNLGILGDPLAADNLLYVGYLNYSDTIKKAAREAFNSLK